MKEINQMPLPAGNDKAASDGNIREQVFSDPKEFLQTLRQHYKEISGGAGEITLPELLYTSEHAPDEKTRAAAVIAAEHIKELSEMTKDDNSRFPDAAKNPTISQDDLDFAVDMNDHKLLGRVAKEVAGDLIFASLAGVQALGGLATAEMAIPVGETFFGGLLSTGGIPLAALGIAGWGAYTAGNLTYQAFKANSNMHAAADRNSAMFKQWIS
jgi:hypothetical protein